MTKSAAAITLCGDVKNLPEANVRQLPCTVHFSGRANVAERFDTCLERKQVQNEERSASAKESADDDDENSDVIEGHFRGYPLVGVELPVPDGYTGVVFTATSSGESRTLRAKSRFDRWTYFNWSTKPGPSDPQQAISEWISVAHAVHVDSDGDGDKD